MAKVRYLYGLLEMAEGTQTTAIVTAIQTLSLHFLYLQHPKEGKISQDYLISVL